MDRSGDINGIQRLLDLSNQMGILPAHWFDSAKATPGGDAWMRIRMPQAILVRFSRLLSYVKTEQYDKLGSPATSCIKRHALEDDA